MLLDAITGESVISVTVGELFALAGGIASLLVAMLGVYQALRTRADRLETRIGDLEDWLADAWKGGQQARGGYKQYVDSLRKDQLKARGAQEEKDRSRYRDDPFRDHPSARHDTLGPGNDTQS